MHSLRVQLGLRRGVAMRSEACPHSRAEDRSLRRLSASGSRKAPSSSKYSVGPCVTIVDTASPSLIERSTWVPSSVRQQSSCGTTGNARAGMEEFARRRWLHKQHYKDDPDAPNMFEFTTEMRTKSWREKSENSEDAVRWRFNLSQHNSEHVPNPGRASLGLALW